MLRPARLPARSSFLSPQPAPRIPTLSPVMRDWSAVIVGVDDAAVDEAMFVAAATEKGLNISRAIASTSSRYG